jgi:hypothetical protein
MKGDILASGSGARLSEYCGSVGRVERTTNHNGWNVQSTKKIMPC